MVSQVSNSLYDFCSDDNINGTVKMILSGEYIAFLENIFYNKLCWIKNVKIEKMLAIINRKLNWEIDRQHFSFRNNSSSII